MYQRQLTDPDGNAIEFGWMDRLLAGKVAPARAIETGIIEVLDGPSELVDRFATTFRLAA
jgi:hypothetical protein